MIFVVVVAVVPAAAAAAVVVVVEHEGKVPVDNLGLPKTTS